MAVSRENKMTEALFLAAVKPNVTVAKDGSGQFTTISDALKWLPQTNEKRVVVFVKAGVYKEYVTIPAGMNNVTLIGEGPLVTRISGDRSNADGGCAIHCFATILAIDGEGFFAKDIGIENTAPKSQVVAVRAHGDMAVFHNVHIDGHQDTLFAEKNRQFYRDCRISGTIDFIFGDAVAVFQKCEIVVREPLPGHGCVITAQGREHEADKGVTVIQGCRITAETEAVKATLGRPWKEYSRVVIMQSHIGDCIQPQGWVPWDNHSSLDKLYYGEYANDGPGSDLSGRVKWEKPMKMTAEMARSFTAEKVFGNDEWIKTTGIPIPYVAGMLPAA